MRAWEIWHDGLCPPSTKQRLRVSDQIDLEWAYFDSGSVCKMNSGFWHRKRRNLQVRCFELHSLSKVRKKRYKSKAILFCSCKVCIEVYVGWLSCIVCKAPVPSFFVLSPHAFPAFR